MATAGTGPKARFGLAAKVSAALAAVTGLFVAGLTARIALRVSRHYARVTAAAVAYVARAATFTLHRRCPDCRSRIDARARVCRHCGLRLAGPR